MMRSVGRVFAWLGVICLLWILDLETGVSAQVRPSVESRSHPASTFLMIVPSPNPLFIRTSADALDAFALHRACATPGDGGPPWLDSRGPPAACESPGVIGEAASHAGRSHERQRTCSSGNSRPERALRKKQSFATAFS